MTFDYERRRVAALKAAVDRFGEVDAVLICDALDMLYLSGLREGIQALVLIDDATLAITSPMFADEVSADAPHCELVLSSTDPRKRPNVQVFACEELNRRGLSKVVIDPAKMPAAAYLKLIAHANENALAFVEAEGLMEGVRAIKDDGEIELTRRCVEIAETAFAELVDRGAGWFVGRTEREIAWELEVLMRSHGADKQGFPVTGLIVAAGPNSAGVHPVPGEDKVVEGQVLLIDWGAELDHYRSDSTRAIFPGTVPEWARKAYPVVEASLTNAAERLRAGVAASEIDQVARQTIADAGFPEFKYGVGHGVGLFIHEAPWLRATTDETLVSNMLTTIEPGIYIPGTGGIRIENIYWVTDHGSERLGTLSSSLDDMVVA